MTRILTLLLAAVVSSSAYAQSETDIKDMNVIPFADPYILYENGIYYLYGTYNDSGIPVVVSDDMKTWRWPDGKTDHMALDKNDSYGDWWFWAPEVYHIGDRYIMYYSSQEHICVAEAASPLGPFKQKVKSPMRRNKGIDNHLFIDCDGTPYLYWVHFNSGLEIWTARLEEDLTTIIPGSEKLCIKTSQAWEMAWPSVNEGPYVLEHKGIYYMTYSANSYESPAYGIGLATAKSPYGPWSKYEGNPILQFYDSMEGVGHHAFFKDAKGKNRIIFHSHNKAGQIHPRILHICRYRIKNGKIIISKKYFTPEMETL